MLLKKLQPLIWKKLAEKIIADASVLENDLGVNPDAEKQTRYNILAQQLEEIINPPSDDEDEENE